MKSFDIKNWRKMLNIEFFFYFLYKLHPIKDVTSFLDEP